MTIKNLFNEIKQVIEEASIKHDVNILIQYIEKQNFNAVGESNSMLANYIFNTDDGYSIKFHYHSYDPSGPFQNLPDTNKIKLQLLNDKEVIDEFVMQFDDKSIY